MNLRLILSACAIAAISSPTIAHQNQDTKSAFKKARLMDRSNVRPIGTGSLEVRRDTSSGPIKYDRREYNNVVDHLLSVNDRRGAVKILEQMVEVGDAKAMVRLASILDKGRGVEADTTRAFTLFERAAELGNDGARLLVGASYARGIVVEADIGRARYWLNQAAESKRREIRRDAQKLLENLS